MKFSEIRYTRPDPEKTIAEFGSLRDSFLNAKSYQEARAVFLEKEEKDRFVNTMDLVAMIRHRMDDEDAFYDGEDKFWWDFEPKIDEYNKAWAEAMLESPFRGDFAAEFGEMMFINAEFDRRSVSKEIIADMQRENELITEYGELMDSIGEIPFEGGTVSTDEIDKIKEDVDGERRSAAYKAEGTAWRKVAPRLDEVYGELIRLRNGMARKLGFDGGIERAYCKLKRTFTKEDVERFRESVVKYVVPVADAIKREQAKRIGGSYPVPYSDNEFFYRNGNPHPAGDDSYIVKEGQKLFDSLSPEAGEFYRHMVDDEMMFVHADGGEDIYLPLVGSPFLMADLDGSGDSVRSFMHEAGHTFAYWMNRERVPSDYIQPSEDITELHSMCMELISLLHAEGFFGEDARKYTYALIAESIAFITYGTMVDHFQHIVFEHPEMTQAERCAEWNRLEGIYEPWIRFDDEIPYYGEGMLWQQQSHIYCNPFMYIDYVLAGVVALEVWAIMQNDPQEAWERYMALVRQGGSRPFIEILKNAGLHSPFDEECLKGVCDTAKKWLDGFDLTGIE